MPKRAIYHIYRHEISMDMIKDFVPRVMIASHDRFDGQGIKRLYVNVDTESNIVTYTIESISGDVIETCYYISAAIEAYNAL